MEIRELNLMAYGPFTDRILIFDQEQGGLYIIYGPNEAGKSSALRGLKALLYGINERSQDNFIHAYDKLRIAGCLRTTNGQELEFVRRKGRKNSLLSMANEPLDEKVLAPFLQGVTLDIFELLFGIDHPALIQGGKEILEQKGEVGEALFSASLGSRALHAVLEQLDKEADELFRPQGTKKAINSALKDFKDLNKAIREQSLSSNEWNNQRDALERTNKELEEIHSEININRAEVHRLERIQRILPKLARRQEHIQNIKALGDIIVLPTDFGERRQKAVTELEKAQAITQKATDQFNRLQGQLEGPSVRQELLDQRESIEAIHKQLGGYHNAIQDRPNLEAEHKQLLNDAESLLKDIRPGLELADVEDLRPELKKSTRINSLAKNKPLLVSQLKQLKTNLSKIEARLKEAGKELQKLPDVGSLQALSKANAAARKSGNLDNEIQSTGSKLATLQDQCAAELSRLTLWAGSIENLPSLPVPHQASIDQFDDQYTELDKRYQSLREKQEKTEEKFSQASQQLEEIQRAGVVQTAEDLIMLRSQRDQAWQLLRRKWIDGEDVKEEARTFDSERTLPDAFEKRMADADQLADHLCEDAELIQKQENLINEKKNEKKLDEEIAQQLHECSVEKKEIDTHWKELWASCEIQPRTPREMRKWLGNLDKLRDQVGQLNTLQQQLNHLKHIRDTHNQLIKQQLQNLGENGPDTELLEATLLKSENFIDGLAIIKRRREVLVEEIKTLKLDLEFARVEHQMVNNELNTWKAQWKDAVEGFGLEGDALPSEAEDIIEKLRELFLKIRDAEKPQIRVQAIDENLESFRNQVFNIVKSIASELSALPAEEAAVKLNKLLSENQTRQSQRQQIEKQLKQTEQDIQESETAIQTMVVRLDAMCEEAKCNSHSGLEVAESRSAEYRDLKAKVGSAEKETLEAGEGGTLSELEVETKEIDKDTLPGKIDALTRKIDEDLEPKRTALAETKGRKEKELELMDGNDHVAELADKRQSVLARIKYNSEKYVRLKLASRILRDEIERFRKENQGPLVKRASEYFAVLTGVEWKELRTVFNEKDEPVLAGIRHNAEEVRVEGMSDGTMDQLYLALRLAALEKYMESSESMPFIADDTLVNFDDNRTEATLRALSDLAQKTQVILFTHHSKVVDLARKLDGPLPVVVLELP